MREREERVTELFRRHADDIHRYATWRVGSQDAADVVGEVFLVAWRSLDRLRAGEERSWLFGVARTVTLARRRQSAASTALGARIIASTVAESNVDRLANGVALRDQVRQTLDVLGEQDREVLVTATWFDLRPSEAARVLGISRPAYAVRLHRARKRFRAAYQVIDDVGDTPTSPVRKPMAV